MRHVFPARWKAQKLDQLGFVGRGRSRHRPRNEPSLYGGEYPFFQTGDIKAANLYLSEYSQTYNEKGLAQSKQWEPGTLCITIAANIADTAILGIRGCFPDSVIGFISDPAKADVHFIKYYIDLIKLDMQQVSHGTTQDNLSIDKLLRFDFVVPDVEEQRKIAAILSAYDDLIENNLRRIKILEEMAQNLYREWFTYPFRGTGMPSPKPSPSGRGVRGEGPPWRLVDSLLGPIPEGWAVVKVTQAVDVNPPERVPKETFKPYVAMEGLSITSMLVTVTAMRKGNSGAKYRNGDTLFARITPCLENGKIGFVQFLSPESPVGIGSTEFIVLRSKTLCPEYVYCLAREEAFRGNAIKSMSGASGRQRVDVKCFEKYFIAHPDSQKLEQFRDKARPIFQKIQVLAKKNNKLRRTRDLLLPKLISGEIDISQLDIAISG